MANNPLAYRMRPGKLEDFYGQEEILGKNKLLYRMIKADKISSIILYGPPGTGKTTISQIIAETTKSRFEKLNAVMAGIADIKKVVEDIKKPMFSIFNKTVLFVDEIHRFNKLQQDALLPYVESGELILIGATTENPYFEVNKALLSRSSIFMLKPLNESNIKKIILKAIADKKNGYGQFEVLIDEEALEFIAQKSNGDARIALNALELAVETSELSKNSVININIEIIENCIQKKQINYDKSGDSHYDNISAFIKSMRGSDPDAAVFYLARALYAGEDPMFLARRIIICAAEDVGMANPSALNLAVSAANAVKIIGMPESRIILSEAAIMVAVSPKSNRSYLAINKALSDVENKDTGEVPMYLRNKVYEDMKELGYGVGYKYSHDYNEGITTQNYLPDTIKGTKYYIPTQNGYEDKVRLRLEYIRKKKGE